MSESRSEVRLGLIVSSEVLSGQHIAEILRMEPSKVIVKGTPTRQPDFPEHSLHIAMFKSQLPFEEPLEKHLAGVLDICEQRREAIVTLSQDCRLTVHCTYLVHREGGWTIPPELCRRMASLPLEYVFAVEPLNLDAEPTGRQDE